MDGRHAASARRGRDVVLVHGTPTSSVIWDGVTSRLSGKYRFHLFDLPGYGQPEKFDGQDVRLRSFAKVLAELIRFKGLKAPILISHDFGMATVFGCHLIEGTPVKAICISDGVVLSPWGTPFSRHPPRSQQRGHLRGGPGIRSSGDARSPHAYRDGQNTTRGYRGSADRPVAWRRRPKGILPADRAIRL
ncbi:MAG: alpha/beta hydrolase [Alphaproteobacteria bacterium]|nr:MAG: alpha/beta hydrolase [Alphaproteobacteria bacterium]